MLEMIPINEAKKALSKYIRKAEHGEAVVISRRGKAVATLVASDEYEQMLRLRAAGPEQGLAGLVGTIENGDELAKLLDNQNRTSRESLSLE